MKTEKPFIDDLPIVKIPRLRALGVITPAMTEYVVKLGEVEQVVVLVHFTFPSGGGWSLFECPACSRLARHLRLLSGQFLCRRCLRVRRIWRRNNAVVPHHRAEMRIPILTAQLASTQSERLKPVLWGTMERRSRREAALRRHQIVLRKHRLKGLKKALAKDRE